MTNDFERPFAVRGTTRGGVLLLPASVAYEFIDAARVAHRRILGVDAFTLTESTAASLLEHILDLSRAETDVDTWQEARRFIEERAHLGLMFEIVV
jgi:hypothetical protein